MSSERERDVHLGESDGAPPRRLVLLRHAKSSWKHEVPDEERPLSGRGRRDAGAVGDWLAEHVGRPDLVLCSTALRTRQTWARACEAQPDVLGPAPVTYEPAIYQAWPDTLLTLVRDLPGSASTVVLVGHSPGVPELAERLHRMTGDAPLAGYPTSALAVLAITGSWRALGPDSARLEAYAVPRG